MAGKFNTTKDATDPITEVAFTIAEFCQAHKISESYYYELRLIGCAPREIQLGTRRIISFEDAAAWRAERAVKPVPPNTEKKRKKKEDAAGGGD
jgi:hypothetical protein